MSTLQWRKNPETTKSRRNLKGCQSSGNLFEAFSTDGEIVVNLKNRLISEQNMNPLLQQKCVFCRDERLPKHKKTANQTWLVDIFCFFKASPTYEQFFKKNICKIRPIPEQNLNRLRQQKSFCSKKESSQTQNSIPNLMFCNCFRKHCSNPSPRTKTLLLNFAKNNEFLKKKLESFTTTKFHMI